MTPCISQMKRAMKIKLIMHIVFYKIRNNTHKIFPLFYSWSLVWVKILKKDTFKVVKHIFSQKRHKNISKIFVGRCSKEN